MQEYEREIVGILREIRAILEPISANHRDQFLRDRKQLIRGIMTPTNRRILPLLLDPRRLTQERIAKEAGVSQATVSRFIAELKQRNLVVEEKDTNLNSRFVDKWKILQLLETEDGN